MLPKQFIVLDLETTGLNPNQNEIIEIAAIKVNSASNTHDTFQSLVKPEGYIPKKITSITGITQNMVDTQGADLEDILNQLSDFIGNLRIVAFNAQFDMGFLKSSGEQYNIKFPNQVSCAYKMARRAWPGLESYKLTELAKTAGINNTGAHRALKDCEMAMKIYASAANELQQIK